MPAGPEARLRFLLRGGRLGAGADRASAPPSRRRSSRRAGSCAPSPSPSSRGATAPARAWPSSSRGASGARRSSARGAVPRRRLRRRRDAARRRGGVPGARRLRARARLDPARRAGRRARATRAARAKARRRADCAARGRRASGLGGLRARPAPSVSASGSRSARASPRSRGRAPDSASSSRAVRGACSARRAVVLALPALAPRSSCGPLDGELAALLARDRVRAPRERCARASIPAPSASRSAASASWCPRAPGSILLGALFMSRVFPGRAPAGRELAELHDRRRALAGGGRRAGRRAARAHRRRASTARSGCARRRCPSRSRAGRAPCPQPGRDHLRLVARLREPPRAAGPLRLAGGYLDGVAVADALASGVRAAEELAAPAGSSRR